MRLFNRGKNNIFAFGLAAALVSYLGFIGYKKRRDSVSVSNIQHLLKRLRKSGVPIRFLFIPKIITTMETSYR